MATGNVDNHGRENLDDEITKLAALFEQASITISLNVRNVRQSPALTNLQDKYKAFENVNANLSDLHKALYKFNYEMNMLLIKCDKMQYLGCMAPIRIPKNIVKKKILLIFFAPSNDTAVGGEENSFDWDPFKLDESDNYVKSFQHLSKALPSMDFDNYYLVDVFPHRIWEQDMEVEAVDLKIGEIWIKKVIELLEPDRIFFANKTYAAKISLMPHVIDAICHPGYTNRNRKLVTGEWKHVVDALNVGEEDENENEKTEAEN